MMAQSRAAPSEVSACDTAHLSSLLGRKRRLGFGALGGFSLASRFRFSLALRCNLALPLALLGRTGTDVDDVRRHIWACSYDTRLCGSQRTAASSALRSALDTRGFSFFGFCQACRRNSCRVRCRGANAPPPPPRPLKGPPTSRFVRSGLLDGAGAGAGADTGSMT